jgi:hypothetical protein
MFIFFTYTKIAFFFEITRIKFIQIGGNSLRAFRGM